MASSSEADDRDTDEFHDACDESELPGEMDLERAIAEAQQAIIYFFNNQFNEAKDLMSPWVEVSMYHSLGNCVFAFLQAMLTFEQSHVVEASEALKKCITVCNKFRKKNTIGETLGKMVKKSNYNTYTEMEVHAELCYAETLLFKALLTFMEDETLSSFIRGSIKIRSCYNSYKECNNILLNRNWDDSHTKKHFESGVRMGIGSFNLMISLLPGRVIKLLEFIGFSGNKKIGLHDLELGYNIEGGLRQVLCVMTTLSYHLIVLNVLSHQDGDWETCERILEGQLKKYPNGVWFLLFKGRLEFMKANLPASIEWYTKSWKSQTIWPQFHHMVFWELLWVHCMNLEWENALTFATYLLQGSKWSRTIYSYQTACILIMKTENMSINERYTLDELLEDVPKYKQRIAGKSLPMEKFAIKKSERYTKQGGKLTLPIIELMFLWNLFKILKHNFQIANNIFKIIQQAHVNLNSKTLVERYDNDNKALLLLLKGACLRQMKSPLQALECLETVIGMEKQLAEDSYLVPYAIVELGLVHMDAGETEKAILAMEDVKKNYTGFLLESRLHFRIHTALCELKSRPDTVSEEN